MSVLVVMCILALLILILPIYILGLILQSTGMNINEHIIKYIIIFFILASILGVLISMSGRTMRNKIAKYIGVLISFLGPGYYFFGYLIPQIILTGGLFSVAIDFLAVIFIFILIYCLGLCIMVSDERGCVIPIIVGIAIVGMCYLVLHIDPGDFKKYQEAIPQIYHFQYKL